MYSPAHVDGSAVVILRQKPFGYSQAESGMLSYDGEVMELASEKGSRSFGEDELTQLQPVTVENRIPACKGFDYFLVASGQ
jgi:hypothetical protein